MALHACCAVVTRRTKGYQRPCCPVWRSEWCHTVPRQANTFSQQAMITLLRSSAWGPRKQINRNRKSYAARGRVCSSRFPCVQAERRRARCTLQAPGLHRNLPAQETDSETFARTEYRVVNQERGTQVFQVTALVPSFPPAPTRMPSGRKTTYQSPKGRPHECLHLASTLIKRARRLASPRVRPAQRRPQRPARFASRAASLGTSSRISGSRRFGR